MKKKYALTEHHYEPGMKAYESLCITCTSGSTYCTHATGWVKCHFPTRPLEGACCAISMKLARSSRSPGDVFNITPSLLDAPSTRANIKRTLHMKKRGTKISTPYRMLGLTHFFSQAVRLDGGNDICRKQNDDSSPETLNNPMTTMNRTQSRVRANVIEHTDQKEEAIQYSKYHAL